MRLTPDPNRDPFVRRPNVLDANAQMRLKTRSWCIWDLLSA